MNILRLNVSRAQRTLLYSFQTVEDETIGRVAKYMSQQDDRLETWTLESARLINPLHALHDLDLRPGDRVVLLEATEEQQQDAVTIAKGYKMVYFRSSTVEVSSRGRNSLTLGKPDPNDKTYVPEIDLSLYVAPDDLEYISRRCIIMEFDSGLKHWKIRRTGRTRVILDDLEIGDSAIAIDRKFQLRFVQADRIIGAMEVDMEAVETDSKQISLQTGSYPIHVRVAVEKSSAWLNVSETIDLRQITDSLKHYWNVKAEHPISAYLMRPLFPETSLKSLAVDPHGNAFLYSGKRLQAVHNTFKLINMVGEVTVFERKVNSGEANIKIGITRLSETSPNSPDFDLRSLTPAQGNPDLNQLTGMLTEISYQESDGTWWIKAEEHVPLSVFLNNVRLTGGSSNQLESEDVLTFGPSIIEYHSRLKVVLETTSE